jgi:REP element-mobilizing transposase RayT
MSRPLRLHAPGLLHHVFARGNNKACIFEDDRDYRTFLELLAKGLARFGVKCVAYCLLWNHYHLAVMPQQQPLWRLMQQVNSVYCRGFNRRHERVGHVLQGRYGCRIVEDGVYARTVIRYLALNPLAAGRVVSPSEWPWSSYQAAVGHAAVPDFLSLDNVWSAFGTSDPTEGRARLIEFVGADPEDGFHDSLLLGSDWLATYAAPRLEPHQANIDFTYAHRYAARPALDVLLEGCGDRWSTQAAAWTAYHRHAYTLAELGRALGRNPSTICRWIQRAAARKAAVHVPSAAEIVVPQRTEML